MYPAFYFFFYQLIIPLRIAFLTINNITIIYFFCSRSSNSLFPALKIKFVVFLFSFFFFFFFFTTRIVCRLSCSDLFKTRSPTGLDKRNKCIKKHVLMLKKTRHSMITMKSQRCPPVSTGNVEMFFSPPIFFFFFFVLRRGGRFGCSSISIGKFFCTSSLSASSHATILFCSVFCSFFLNESSRKAEKKIGVNRCFRRSSSDMSGNKNKNNNTKKTLSSL